MSKERARRRAERLAVVEAGRVARERRDRRRSALRRLVPHLPRRRTGKLFARRSRAQRASIAAALALVLIVVWALVDSLALRIGFTVIAVLATPTLVVLTLDRRI